MKKIIGLSVIVLIFLGLFIKSCTTVHTGEVGIVKQFGEIQKDSLAPGLHFINPFISSVDEYLIREVVISDTTECFTKDTQAVNINFSVTYSVLPGKIVSIVTEAGKDWVSVLLTPALYGRMKDVTGQYVSDELVMKRAEVKAAVLQHIQSKVKGYGIIVSNIEFTNIQFNKEYQTAVELKTVAVQKALQAKNKTVEIEEEAKQKVITAKAEAESIRIKSAALSNNSNLTKFEAIKRWDGKLPQIVGGNTGTMFNIPLKD